MVSLSNHRSFQITRSAEDTESTFPAFVFVDGVLFSNHSIRRGY